MNKEREALKLALEALEEAHYKHEHRQDATKRGQAITAIEAALAQPSDSVKQEPVNIVLDSWDAWASSTEYDNKNHDLLSALKDIRKALALTSTTCEVQPERFSAPCRCGKETNGWCMANSCTKAGLAQPEQGLFVGMVAKHTGLAEELAQPVQESKPVAWMHKIDCCPDDRIYFNAYYKRTPGYCIPLYTAPPKRQPLTDEQIDNLGRKEKDALLDFIYENGTASEGGDYFFKKYARVILAAEAKLKEKNK